jgi:hypothetical protein
MMLDGTKCGFPPERLRGIHEPRVKCDKSGYYLYTINENVKVYFEDYYRFLEKTELTAQKELDRLIEVMKHTPPDRTETLSYYRARKLIVGLLLRTVRGFYGDSSNLGVIMSPWCFGTVALEKVEIYKEQVAKGEIEDSNIPDYPFFVLRYVNDIYKQTLLELFGFPEKAFSMRWQYTELLKRYSQVLTNVTSSLENVLDLVKKYGSPSET